MKRRDKRGKFLIDYHWLFHFIPILNDLIISRGMGNIINLAIQDYRSMHHMATVHYSAFKWFICQASKSEVSIPRQIKGNHSLSIATAKKVVINCKRVLSSSKCAKQIVDKWYFWSFICGCIAAVVWLPLDKPAIFSLHLNNDRHDRFNGTVIFSMMQKLISNLQLCYCLSAEFTVPKIIKG